MQKINKFFEHGQKKPKYLVVLLHGYGSNGEDLISLGPDLEKILPESYFIAPNAPLILPHPFFPAFQWFELYSREPAIIYPQIIAANNILDEFIQSQLQRFDLTYNNLILVGFSQGAMMALYNSLRAKEEVAGVLSLSGRLILPTELQEQINSKPKICLIHGNEDLIVPFEFFLEAKEKLSKLDFDFEAHAISHLGHSINIEVLRKSQEFFKKISS